MRQLKRFLLSHPGKMVAGVCLADLLIAWPPALSWIVAGYLLYWAMGHFRQSFRSLDAEPQISPVAVVLRAEPATLSEGDLLDMATRLDMAARRENAAAVLGRELVLAAPSVGPEEGWQRLPA